MRHDPAALLQLFMPSGVPYPWIMEWECSQRGHLGAQEQVRAAKPAREVTFVGYDRDRNPQFVFFCPAMDPYMPLPAARPPDSRARVRGLSEQAATGLNHSGLPRPLVPDRVPNKFPIFH